MSNSQKGKIDMTTGHIMRNIILFAIPIIIGNVLQQLYTTVDALVIGKYCGDTSLAAVGTSSQPVEVLLCVFLGIGTGVSILISQYTGAKESGKVVSVCGTSITFIYIIGIPIGILGWFAAPYILEFMKVPKDVWDAALIYTRVVFLGTLGNLGYNMNAGILRGLGDSKASLWFLVVSCVSNIVFDLLFVAGFGMDVAGAALSTEESTPPDRPHSTFLSPTFSRMASMVSWAKDFISQSPAQPQMLYRKLWNICWPCWVCSTSGWNWVA